MWTLTTGSVTERGESVLQCKRRISWTDTAFRPVCSRCQALRTECIYEAEEGESRWSAIRRQNKAMESERDELREILQFLQSQPEPEALEIFHQMRSSDTPESMSTILQLVRERRPSSNTSSARPSIIGGQTRLPPIRTMLDASEAATSPTGSTDLRRASLASDGSGASYSSEHSAYEIATSRPPSG